MPYGDEGYGALSPRPVEMRVEYGSGGFLRSGKVGVFFIGREVEGGEGERRGVGMSGSGYEDDVRSCKEEFGMLLRKCGVRLRDCYGGDVRSIGSGVR